MKEKKFYFQPILSKQTRKYSTYMSLSIGDTQKTEPRMKTEKKKKNNGNFFKKIKTPACQSLERPSGLSQHDDKLGLRYLK